MKRSIRKGIAAVVVTLILMLLLLPVAASAQNTMKDDEDYALSAYALQEDVGASLYLNVSPTRAGDSAPESVEKVQLKVYDDEGKHLYTRNETNLPSPGGKLAILLDNTALGYTVSIDVRIDQSGKNVKLEAETAVTEFAVNANQVVVPEFMGYGTQLNMHLYTALNDPARGFTGNEPPKELANVEAKVKALKPGLTRIFLSPVNFDPGNENRMESFIKTVELAHQAGAIVNVTWWFMERAPGDDPAKQALLMQENMRQFADTLIDLVTTRGLTAVQQITIQNEVNTTWIKPELYEQYYRLLDQYLVDAGIRDSIQFVGGDLVFNNQLTWFTYMADHMGDVLDGWSVHIYWNYWDTAYMQKRFTDIMAIYNNIAPEKRKPLSITEYGVRGHKVYEDKTPIMDVNPYRRGALTATLAGKYEDLVTAINETNIAAFEQAWFDLQAVNLGFVGLAKWDAYRAQYDFSYQDHSLIGYLFNPAPREDRWPLRPAYYMQWLLANTTGQGWQVLGYNGDSGAKLITPFRSPDGEWTVLALSRDGAAASFHIGSLPANTEFKVLLWNGDGSGKVTNAGTVNSSAAGTATVDAPADSVVALTTVSVVNLP